MKNKKRKKHKNIDFPFGAILVISVTIIVLISALIFLRKTNIENTKQYQVTISNVEYDSLNKAGYWANFSTEIGDCYYLFRDYISPKIEKENLEILSSESKKVTISIVNKYNPINYLLCHYGRKHVVDIRSDDKIYLSIDNYNKDLVIYRFLFIIFALLVLIPTIWYLVFMLKTRKKKNEKYKK